MLTGQEGGEKSGSGVGGWNLLLFERDHPSEQGQRGGSSAQAAPLAAGRHRTVVPALYWQDAQAESGRDEW